MISKSGSTAKGMFICFTGIDGSGKTLQAERLVENLKARGIPCAYTWCRYSPRIFAPLTWLVRTFIRRKRGKLDYGSFTSAKRGILRKPILGWVWLNISLFEYLVQVRRTLGSGMRNSRNLVCDRYVYDMLADLSVNFDRSDDGVMELAKHPLIRLFPKPDRVFFLDVPPEVALQRKDDPNVMGKQYLVDRAKVYSYLSGALGFTRIDGTKSIEEIADIILSDSIAHIESAGCEVKS
jgi:thymidylate kinase